MEQRLSIITLGVRDLNESLLFYQALGLEPSPKSQKEIVFFQLNGFLLALYPWDKLAEDVGVEPEGRGFRGVTLAYNGRTPNEVDRVLEAADRTGGEVLKPAQEVFWGGYSGYFRDPSGHLWEVAFNPFMELDDSGHVSGY